ncbi:hypothetical protein D3C76_1681660 [compost metagenome]
MPVIMVSYSAEDACSWYSSTIAQEGELPSPGSPISGSKRLPSSGSDRFITISSAPHSAISSGVFLSISRAGRNTSMA